MAVSYVPTSESEDKMPLRGEEINFHFWQISITGQRGNDVVVVNDGGISYLARRTVPYTTPFKKDRRGWMSDWNRPFTGFSIPLISKDYQ